MNEKMWLEDINGIVNIAVNKVQRITGLGDDDPVINKLVSALEKVLDTPEISHGDWRNYN